VAEQSANPASDHQESTGLLNLFSSYRHRKKEKADA
jgi:hypothetical protein